MKSSNQKNNISIAYLFATLGLAVHTIAIAAIPLPPTSWDAAAEFNPAVNPVGVWSYGSIPGPNCTDAFTPLPTPYTTMGSIIRGFRPAGPSDLPLDAQNQTKST